MSELLPAEQYLPRLRETAADIERMLTTWPEDKRDGNYKAHADDAAAYRWAADEIERLAADAARYRWLRAHIAPSIITRIDKATNNWPPENLDALVDARLQGTR